MSEILEFGIKRENEERRDGGCAVVFDPKSQKYAVNRIIDNNWLGFFSGGVEDGEDMQEGILREVTEEGGLYDFLYVEKIAEAECHFYASLKKLNRVAHATCLLVILKSTDLKPTKLEEHEKFELTWVTTEEMFLDLNKNNKDKNRDHWIYFFKKAVNRAIELGYDKTSKKI
ncbi:MAG: NUDIX domain-containing protein [Burkholderiales bacterium]|nr:NUDIX domain-containing protein [Burkholderiales bacterium]